MIVAASTLAAAGCGRDALPAPSVSAAAVDQPAGWDADLALAVPPDLNPDPNVLEVELEAKIATVDLGEGVQTTAWTYNGVLPGPLLRAKLATA